MQERELWRKTLSFLSFTLVITRNFATESLAMASIKRLGLLFFTLALLCILFVSNLSQIGAETSENDDLEIEELDGGAYGEGTPSWMGLGEEEEEFDEFDDHDGEEGEGSDVLKSISERDVVVLGSGNFTAFVKENHYVLVEFYAPWCGHCQELVPEWAAAATALKGDVSLVKIDATTNDELANKYGVKGYPSIFFFIDGVHKPFTGQRTKDEIVKWVKKKIGPSVTIIHSESEAEGLLNNKSPIVVAYLENVESSEAEELISAARQEEAVTFYMTSNPDVARMFDLEPKTRPVLVLLKKEHEKRAMLTGIFERKALYEFVFANKLPLVIDFNRENAPSIFDSEIKKQVLLFADEEDHVKLRSMYEQAARPFRGKLIFIYVNLSDSESNQILEFFGITGEQTSIMGFMAEEDGRKFLYEGDITLKGLKAFGEGFLANKLKPYLKSQPVPEMNDDDVKIAVGKNFEEIVLDESKDTLLEIYAPWCGHCQALEPIYKKLGKKLRGIESLSVVKMDGSANDHPRAKSDGFPTILFFPAGKKSFEPITFDGERTIKGFYQFLKKNVVIPFSLPKSAKSKSSRATPELVQGRGTDLKDEL